MGSQSREKGDLREMGAEWLSGEMDSYVERWIAKWRDGWVIGQWLAT